MENLISAVGVVATHLAAGLIGVFSMHWIEPMIKRRQRRKQLRQLSWLFPISDQKPEMHFKCSLKPGIDFKPAPKDDGVFAEFFGQNPPSYRKYVHSAEVLALQMITEKLTPLGVRFVDAGFYGGTGNSGNLLLIGSDANNKMSDTILAGLQERIGYDAAPNGHRYFSCGKHKYGCKHTGEAGSLTRVTEDCGVIVRRTLSDGRVVLLLAGVHMHGTLAAACVALNPAFQRRVLESKHANFAQLVRVTVLDDGTSIDVNSLDEWDKLPFVNLD